MAKNSPRKWWQYRRIQWPAASALALALAAGVAVHRSQNSQIVVYNDTSAAIPELAVSACGQTRVFHQVEPSDSVRFTLAATGQGSEATLATNNVPVWHGGYMEPRGGYRTLLHLRQDGEVESFATLSGWQSLWRQTFNSEL